MSSPAFFATHTPLHQLETQLLVLPVFETKEGYDFTTQFDDTTQARLRHLCDAEGFSGKPGTELYVIHQPDLKCKRILFIGLGKIGQTTNGQYRAAVNQVIETLFKTGAENMVCALTQALVKNTPTLDVFRQTITMLANGLYEYTHTSRGEFSAKSCKVKTITLPCCDDTLEVCQAAIDEANAAAAGMQLTRDLANLPANYATPSYLASVAQELAKEYGFGLRIIEEAEAEQLGMGSFLSVARGSHQPAKIAILEYQGAVDAPLALIGKGVTFDTGGISLKPGAKMDEMKYDMAGAATVLGTFKALGQLKPKLHVVGIIGATENMPSGKATKPGDVVTSMSGKTIEVLNTDAEGRLVLADLLTLVQQEYNPKAMIDMATLTGACVVALGKHLSGMMSNNPDLANAIQCAGEQTYDRVWPMPLHDEYDKQLKSNFADMANIGGPEGGAVTAACFLKRFVDEGRPWAHLDIAGTAWVSGDYKGATGRPLPLILRYLASQAN